MRENTGKMKRASKVLLVIFAVLLLIAAAIFIKIKLSQWERAKYQGHGFEYMHGLSSTDFTGYHVYDGEKLVTLDHEPPFVIEDVDKMPVLDGAEACYPIYTAVAKTLYKDIDVIESEMLKSSNDPNAANQRNKVDVNGRVVTFSNSSYGYERLIYGSVDLFIGARPSEDQKQLAKEFHEQIISTPIGKEAFVFFVEEDNPVDNLTSEEIRGIYHGDITNWKELGGKNQKIIAFQRPDNSGSQVAMRYFMGSTSLKDPDVMERIGGMGEVISEVKQYHNEAGAIGYTFQYFLTGLQQEKGVKMLSVDGVYPSVENIKNGSYPILVNLICARIASNNKPEVKQVLDYLLSEDGQAIIEGTGYGPLGNTESKDIIENEIEEGSLYILEKDGHSGSLLMTSEIFELEYDGHKVKGSYYLDDEAKPQAGVIAEYRGNIVKDWFMQHGSNVIIFELLEDGYRIKETFVDEIIATVIPPEEDLVLPEAGDFFKRR